MTNSTQYENQEELEQLAWAIETSVGKFKLILARCNYVNLQNQLITKLQEICPVGISILHLDKSSKALYTAIQEEFANQQIQALMIVGWESLPNLTQILSSANQVREEFRRNFNFPIVLWINQQIYQKMKRNAPDLESWSTRIKFTMNADDLRNLLQSKAELAFNNLDLNLPTEIEIKIAWQDLQINSQDLEPELKANLNFLLGMIANKNQDLDSAISYYQESLYFWQTTNNLKIQGKILYNLIICNYEKFRPKPPNSFPTIKTGEIKNYLLLTLEALKITQCLDLIFDSLDKFAVIFQDLQEWEQLKDLVQQALIFHQQENNQLLISQDYRIFAEVALAQLNYQESKKLAELGLKTLENINTTDRKENLDYQLQEQHLLLILAISQDNLNLKSKAIDNLKIAQKIGIINNQPEIYIKILTNLKRLLFANAQYIEAFDIKLEARSIEQQFGLRAFIGAGRLQSKKKAKFPGENIAPEIEASGRIIDVEELVKRIVDPNFKLIVIHGQSGVGKSSLVNAGLIPGLQNKVISYQDNLPVSIRVYKNWFAELKQKLLDVLPSRLKREYLTLDTQEEFILKLQELENNNLRTVLIFDQFEELFFYSDNREKQTFFQFLGQCLNILSLKVILSLRVDYLHLLLDCNKLESMKIISQDILSKNVLYELGNLTTENAQLTIKSLTENTTFNLEPDLINRLLQDLSGKDLAGELGSVRPIELQVVGAQLENENIRTLAEYEKYGNKQELVKRYLDEVVKDCGKENKEIANLLLYFLTDEQGTRPLKTKSELERNLQSLAAVAQENDNRLDLVLDIFVKSGLVVLLPESPADRYQLVHDYLALFIRQQQEPTLKGLKAIIAEMEKEIEQYKYILISYEKSASLDINITKEKQLEEHFLRAQRLESLGTLASGIAHDINNILTPILAAAQLLKGRFAKDEERYSQLLAIIENNAKRGAALVKQVLSFARGIKGERVIVKVKHLIVDIIQIAKQTFPISIEFTIQIQEDLRAVAGDPTQLHQVLMNLVVNARDAMPEGGNLKITADNIFIDEDYTRMHLESKVGHYIVITVIDTGMGMTPKILNRIFEPFFTTKEVGAGLGLGLSVALGIIKSHEGFITVSSQVGKGSIFKIFLPAVEVPQAPNVDILDVAPGQGELILVVDDEQQIRDVVTIILETHNYQTLTASNGIEAIAVYAQHKKRIKAVLMNIMMPEMDGITAIRTLQKMNPQVQIIACSGLNAIELLPESGEIEVQAVLLKPYTASDLLRHLNQILTNQNS
ncbi:hypothetical protein NIES4074_62240 (plasmid) [Cylindrospermum sp. NIES-4074]|nr:hypothetical protein NIES4074_62240 [Cylindrospermum sp. NIES-4074]